MDVDLENIIVRTFEPADRDWLISAHRHYEREDGFDASFVKLVAEIIDDFLAYHDPNFEAGWIAARGEERLGSIFCVRLDERTAKLRLFLVVSDARGLGLGRRLLVQCMQFAASRGYKEMQLWTHESHRAACGLYRDTGWVLQSSRPVHSFGQDLTEQTWTFAFDAKAPVGA